MGGAVKSFALRHQRKTGGKQAVKHTIAAISGRVSTAPVTLAKLNIPTLEEIERKYGKCQSQPK